MAESANIVNKMSLYDLLTLIIPGSMVVAVLYVGAFPWIKAFSFSWIVSLAIFGAMYLIGLLLKNWSLQKDSSIFDKNMKDIKETYSNFAKDTNHKLEHKEMTYNDYCADYYYAVDHYSNSKIAILEAHIAFLRTMQYSVIVLWCLFFMLSIAYLVILICTFICQLEGWLYYTILILNCVGLLVSGHIIRKKELIVLAHSIQKKVYEGVIYDSYYNGGPITKIISNNKK